MWCSTMSAFRSSNAGATERPNSIASSGRSVSPICATGINTVSGSHGTCIAAARYVSAPLLAPSKTAWYRRFGKRPANEVATAFRSTSPRRRGLMPSEAPIRCKYRAAPPTAACRLHAPQHRRRQSCRDFGTAALPKRRLWPRAARWPNQRKRPPAWRRDRPRCQPCMRCCPTCALSLHHKCPEPVEGHIRAQTTPAAPASQLTNASMNRRNLAESTLGQEWPTPGISISFASLISASQEAYPWVVKRSCSL
jgi:hypothetical protein